MKRGVLALCLCAATVLPALSATLGAAQAATPKATPKAAQKAVQKAEAPAAPARNVAPARNAAACSDFNRHANGRWLERSAIPPDRARIGSFDQAAQRNEALLKRSLDRLLAEPARQDTPGLKLLATWYAGATDDAVAERAGLRAAQPLLQRISALAPSGGSERRALSALLGLLARQRIAAPLALQVQPDSDDVRRHALVIAPTGLGLARLDDEPDETGVAPQRRGAYRAYAERLLQLAAAPHDAATLDALVDFEAGLARLERLQPDARNGREPLAVGHRFTLAQLQARAPGIDWYEWLLALGLPLPPGPVMPALQLVAAQPDAVEQVAALVENTPLPVWQSYLRVRLLDALAPWLAPDFRAAHFDFHERGLRGVPKPPPRPEQVLRQIGGRLGNEPLAQALGELYVRDHWPPAIRQQVLPEVQQMVNDVRAAMAARIAAADWMDAATRERAQAKLAALLVQLGLPERGPDYSGLTFDRADPAGNWLRANAWLTAHRLAALALPVDRTRWQTAAYVANASAISLNRIVLPAGLLQPPFFDLRADAEANYGALGVVIAHEITHHFDERGRQYDEQGNLADWWSAESTGAFQRRAERVVALYSAIEVQPGQHIDGRRTLGENLADLGGLRIAHLAWQRALKRQPAPITPSLRGSAAAQRFFAADALTWRNKPRPEALDQQLRKGAYSPSRYRINVPLANLPAFGASYGCRSGDAMQSAHPVHLW